MPDCTDCKYFHPNEAPDHDFPGECRRYPPIQHSTDSQYTYTPVNQAAWCGEWASTGDPQ